ncbi:Kinesin domain-containing protein/DUF3490 domain-containing protein [Cephalotus follicularis]|uniref:Kinesin-like protein n=1 Tax=Cephalotus follicularis TaxID=3775 RepID=A0A1Q3C6T5_CEPFO|nr:Kinesin domain-containing protein/DUF3490 domain-containing protein [Cephalotus follicularis]
MGTDDGEEQMQGPSGREERFVVSVRMRPLNEKEIAQNDVSDWECINDTTILYRNNLSVSERSMYPSAYTFDNVFRVDCSTRKVYEKGAREVVLSVVNGINASVFAYGQTSSGKTYTMSGITEYAMADIYDCIEKRNGREYILKFSAMEIYNESVKDLLSADSTQLRLLDDPERGTIVEKLTEETLKDWNHFKELLSACEAQRQIGETALNEASSRSHQILRLTIESSAHEFVGNDKSSTLTATVNFVDLAGSERASQSLSAGTRLKEGCHINRSLLTLGTVIRKLSKGRNGHVPFRDSKLTRILQSTLGGNARTAIICTMSPARTHVEQSRNTLLFASCAKEVTTNARVNVVMSDKLLVKHLQRELARLESELRNPRSTSITFDSSPLLREKDIQIEKLKKEMTELTVQRDLALSQVVDLLQKTEDRPSMVPAVLGQEYPKLIVRSSWDFENPMSEVHVMADSHHLPLRVRTVDTSDSSDGHSSSSIEYFPQLPDFKENYLHTSSSLQLSIHVPDIIGSDMNQDDIEEVRDEDLCKEVQCIDMEEQSVSKYVGLNFSEDGPIRFKNLNMTSPETNTVTSKLTEVENGDAENLEFRSSTLKDKIPWNGIHPDFVIPSAEKSSPWVLEKETSSCRSSKLVRSRSCKASLMTNSSSCGLEKKKNNESTPPMDFQEKFTGRPDGFQRKISALKYGDHFERLVTNKSPNSATVVAIDEFKAQSDNTSNDVKSTGVSALDSRMREKPDLECEKQLADYKVQEAEPKPILSAKSVKDVELDPIEVDLKSPSRRQPEYRSLQSEIIELWHACNVSLVHRTYFFLLFKGDTKDSIYMEVELRRLSFLKDALLRGDQTVEDGQTLTPTSSMRALHHERHLLSQLMKNRLSEENRENLFLKWGIGLNTKNRRLNLVQRLWTNTEDMDHITESATVIAKLVGFVEPEQDFKGMFGVNQSKRKKFSRWIRSVMSLL